MPVQTSPGRFGKPAPARPTALLRPGPGRASVPLMSQPTCPSCRRPVAADAPSFPFCNERCRLLDLGNWLDGRYAVRVPDEEDAGTSDDGDDRNDRSDLG